MSMRAGEADQQLRALTALSDERMTGAEISAPTSSGSQPPVTLVLGNLMPSPGLYGKFSHVQSSILTVVLITNSIICQNSLHLFRNIGLFTPFDILNPIWSLPELWDIPGDTSF